ncbi:expressed unknown protein [Seminavis robusta]|uniref:Uncharacterized protein n=1 Tax=Seminavis robusta TaxID=568900 RepID=A0A9N8DFN2_9STRA|nr:expressed unknown protein [Seminavis robusta]|eukprot:Sro70_g039180.1 n/a (415) ;mRNA; f:126428-127761
MSEAQTMSSGAEDSLGYGDEPTVRQNVCAFRESHEKENIKGTGRSSFDSQVVISTMRQSVSPLSQFTPSSNLKEQRREERQESVETAADDNSSSRAFEHNCDEVALAETTKCEDSNSTPLTSTFNAFSGFHGFDCQGEELVGATPTFVSPRDSDSFDWRNEISPLVPSKYNKPTRRSSILFRPHRHTFAQSPFQSPPLASLRVSSNETTNKANSPNSIAATPVERQTTTGIDTCEHDNWQSSASTAFLVPSISPGIPRSSQPNGSLRDVITRLPGLGPISEAESGKATDGPNGHGTSYEILLQENHKLRNRLLLKSKSYEKGILPFRNLFEMLPKLRSEIEALKEENAKLREEKDDEVVKTIAELQMQMTNAMRLAIEKTDRLEKELELCRAKSAKLEEKISAAHAGAHNTAPN